LEENNPFPELPLIISTDVEGGSVRRYESWKPNISSAKTLYQRDDLEATFEQYQRIAERLTGDGINMNLAPVLDISKNQDSTFLGKRIFGKDPEKVSEHAVQAILGTQAGGALSVGKHYPGHGGTATDSHASTPVIDKGLSELLSYDLIPFKNAVDAGIDGMLVGHILFPNIDSEVSSVSYTFITEILREEFGFDGMVMSDDMRMGGITKHMSCGEAAVRFVEAGGNMVLIGKYLEKQTDVFESLYEALESGRLTRERLEESVYRIIRLKQKVAV
ncbi:MAG: glycoside hydrolase family 3 protein, partial [Christensenellaceae bacterium]|nr:glycoside hydrolase family 3 protein [Christensenellaceae bacterium]